MPSGEEGINDGGSATPSKEKKDSSDALKRHHARNGHQNNKPAVIRQPRFEGKCKSLKGHIYDCSDARQMDMFSRTTKEIAEYVGRTYKEGGGDLRLIVENLELPEIVPPLDPPAGASRTDERIWEKNADAYVKRLTTMEENVKTLYSLVWGQCSDIMRQKIEALDDFEVMKATGDGIGLLRAIKTMSFSFQSQKYLPHALHDIKRRFYTCSQGKMNTTQAYLEQFQNIVDAIHHSGGSVGQEPGIEMAIAEELGVEIDDLPKDERNDIKKQAQERYLAVAFLLGSDRTRFG